MKKSGKSLSFVGRRSESNPAPVGEGERRSAARRQTAYNASCTMRTVSYNVELLDLSPQGARVRMRQGLVPEKGQRISIRLMNGQSIDCVVSWVAETDIGLQFNESLADAIDCANFDEMGSDFYKSVLKYQISRNGD